MRVLSQTDARKILAGCGVSFPRFALATTETEAADAAKKMGWPVALKVSSPDIIHKTEVGGVVLDVRDEFELRQSFRKIVDMTTKVGARLDGIIVEEMVRGREFIVGAKQDPQFGPVVAFGLGGIYVELFKDVTWRIAPLKIEDVREMIAETRAGAAILAGARGERPSVSQVEKTLLAASDFIEANPRVVELDINPLIASEERAVAVDVRLVLSD